MRQGTSRQAEHLPSLLGSGTVNSALNRRRKTCRAGLSQCFVCQGSKRSHGRSQAQPRYSSPHTRQCASFAGHWGTGQGSRALVPTSKPKTRRQRWRLHWSSRQTDFQKNLGSQRDRKKAPRPGSCLRLRWERSRGLRLPPLLPHAGLPATPEWPSPEPWTRKRGPGRRGQDQEPHEPGMPRRAHNGHPVGLPWNLGSPWLWGKRPQLSLCLLP